MVRTRAQLTMDRSRLEHLSMEQLREEASIFGVPIVSDRSGMIDALMTHLERRGPADLLSDTASGAAERSRGFKKRPIPAQGEQSVTAGMLQEVLASMGGMIQQ